MHPLPLSVNLSHISSSLLLLSSHPAPAPLIRYTILALYKFICVYVCMYCSRKLLCVAVLPMLSEGRDCIVICAVLDFRSKLQRRRFSAQSTVTSSLWWQANCVRSILSSTMSKASTFTPVSWRSSTPNHSGDVDKILFTLLRNICSFLCSICYC